MLVLLFLTVFLAAGATANRVAGKYQILAFYQLYRLEVDAYGLANSRMAPGCAKNGVVCNMKQFVIEVSVVTQKTEKDANGQDIMLPNGEKKFIDDPDFAKVNWEKIGEGGDLRIFAAEFDNSGFAGRVDNKMIFKEWNKDNNFENVMNRVKDIGDEALARLEAEGREPADGRVEKLSDAVEAHLNARRYDQAKKANQAFKKEFPGFDVAYTDPIERPPVPAYEQIDTDRTIRDNQGRAGFDQVEQRVRNFVTNYNSASGDGWGHYKTIIKTREVHGHFAQACRRE